MHILLFLPSKVWLTFNFVEVNGLEIRLSFKDSND